MAGDHFHWYGNQIIVEVNKRSNQETLRVAQMILDDAKANCPFDARPNRDPTKPHLRDTGKLVMLRGNKIEVRFTAPHAAFVHDGTSRMAARPFLLEATMRNAPELANRTRKLVKRG